MFETSPLPLRIRPALMGLLLLFAFGLVLSPTPLAAEEEPPAENADPAPASPQKADDEEEKPDEGGEDPGGEPGEPAPQPQPGEEGPEGGPAAVPALPELTMPEGHAPGGMVAVGTTEAQFGTKARTFLQVVAGHSAGTKHALSFERPDHKRTLRPYYMDVYEVTNAQYAVFLEQSKQIYNTGEAGNMTLVTVSQRLLDLTDREAEDNELRYWFQLYMANWEAIHAAFGEKMAGYLVKTAEGEIDHERTAATIKHVPLPRELELTFYTNRPPYYWPGMLPPKGMENHPVRGVSYLDARAFAEWAGKHIPSEFQWEYAARGPNALIYPWGDDWPVEIADQKRLGNWGGNFVDKSTYTHTTTSVDSHPDGASWCGVFHLIGNVAEWTSSWFQPYPGYEAHEDNPFLKRFGTTIKVIRGGYAGELEKIVLRSSARNFIGNEGVYPYPENRFDWVGFRCAWYPQAGMNHLEPVLYRATRGGWVKEEHLDIEGYQGGSCENLAPPGAVHEHHVYVQEGSHSMLHVPLTQVLWEVDETTGDQWMREAWEKPNRWDSTKDLIKRSAETETPRIILGVLELPARLVDVRVEKPLEEGEEDKPERGGRRRGRDKGPEVIPGSVPAGTYVLTFWHGRLALADRSLQFKCYLGTEDPKNLAKDGPVQVHKFKPDEVPENTFKIDTLDDHAVFKTYVPLGGRKSDGKVHLEVNVDLRFELAALDSLGAWRQR